MSELYLSPDWIVAFIIGVISVSAIFGYLIGRWHGRQIEIYSYDPTLVSTKTFRLVGESIGRAIIEVRKECRGQPLSLSRILRHYNHHYASVLRYPVSKANADLRIYQIDGLYHFEVVDYNEEFKIVVILPVEWITEGIDDVELCNTSTLQEEI